MKNKKINFKRIIIIATLIYVVYTFFVQQKELNAYKADSERYSEQIATEEEKKEKLLETKSNINSKEYIEQFSREKLDFYLPNEKVYIDISK